MSLLAADIIIEVFVMLSIVCIQTFLYYKTIGFRQNWSISRLILAVSGTSIFAAAAQIISFKTGISLAANLTMVAFLLYPICFMGGRLKEQILFGILNLAIFIFSILLTGIMVYPRKLTINGVELMTPSAVLIVLLLICTCGLLTLAIAHISTEGKRYMPGRYWAALNLCFLGIFVALLCVCQFRNDAIEAEDILPYLTIFTLGILVIWLLVYLVFYYACRYFSEMTETQALAIQNDMIERYVLRRQASDERIKILSHDLKHSLIQWRTLAEEKGDVKALHHILEYEEQLKDSLLINVENESANAVINQKNWEADQKNIDFRVEGAFHKDLVMSEVDICSLLGNLLDNALEAAALVEAEELRRIKLSIRRRGNLLLLSVENGYDREPVLENGSFITSKKDKDLHAIGTCSIHRIVEKYDGIIRNSYQDNWFKANLMLRGYEIVLSDKNETFQRKYTQGERS